MADSPTPEFPHISLRVCAFYVFLLALFTGELIKEELNSTLVTWLGFITLILIQVFQEVWWLRHPDPRDDNE